MKNQVYLFLAAILVLLASCQLENETERSESANAVLTNNTVKKEDMRAKEGENTLLIINHVKEESKLEYEQFMQDVFFTLIRNSSKPLMKDQYHQTRWLTPARQNKDKTWTYVFFMDPLVENGNYEFLPLFQEKYAKEEAERLLEQHNSFMASPPDFYPLIQSKH